MRISRLQVQQEPQAARGTHAAAAAMLSSRVHDPHHMFMTLGHDRATPFLSV
jgi:hypothetical protein